MARIYNKLFCSDQLPEHRSLFGVLKRFEQIRPQVEYKFTADTSQALIIIINIDAVGQISSDDIRHIVHIYNEAPGSKILIDTSIEDFVNDNFRIVVATLERMKVEPLDIIVLVGEANVSWFASHFKIYNPIVHANTFEMSYYIALHMHNKELLDAPVMPRKLTKHFIDFKKNSRFLRKVFHAFMMKHNYNEKAFYSWYRNNSFSAANGYYLHDLGVYKDEEYTAEVIDMLNTTHILDDTEGAREWFMPEEIHTGGGINLIHETHPSIDLLVGTHEKYSIFTEQANSFKGMVFFTEKTYKNFVYGLPFLNPGVPGTPQLLRSTGYMTWDDMFNVKIDHSDYIKCIRSYMKLIHEIAAMPLQDLEDLLNSDESMRRAKHNKEVFLEQRQFEKLQTILRNLTDKY
jgi:hypothetical protein